MTRLSKVVLASAVIVVMAWSPASFAGCTWAQVSGIWEVAFSSGVSCRLKLKKNATIDVESSVCFDPDRGAAAPDSGVMAVKANCFAEGELVTGGTVIELPVQFSHDRSIAAGRYRVPADGSKGSVVMVRVP
jgi:hypothetical protein